MTRQPGGAKLARRQRKKVIMSLPGVPNRGYPYRVPPFFRKQPHATCRSPACQKASLLRISVLIYRPAEDRWVLLDTVGARGFSLKHITAFAGLHFVAADIGNFTGGLASGYLIKRGMAVVRVRKWVCVVSSLPILAGIPAATTHNPYWAIILISFAVWNDALMATVSVLLLVHKPQQAGSR